MQINSLQFKCRFWHFSRVGKRMKRREGKKHCVEFPPKLNQQQFNTYLYSNQLFVYTFKKNATNVTER